MYKLAGELDHSIGPQYQESQFIYVFVYMTLSGSRGPVFLLEILMPSKQRLQKTPKQYF